MRPLLPVVLAAVLTGCARDPAPVGERATFAAPVRVATWNLQAYGPSKASDKGLLRQYRERIIKNDITVLQEVRDTTGKAADALCRELEGYGCRLSTRAGSTRMKEQYLIAYRNQIGIMAWDDYATHADARKWERPPLQVTFDIHGYRLTIYTLHAKPAAVRRELMDLERVVGDPQAAGNTVVLGDLNADCASYKPRDAARGPFRSWFWAISAEDDTTTGRSDCAYDRILLNHDARREYMRHGIDEATPKESDHHLAWVELGTQDR